MALPPNDPPDRDLFGVPVLRRSAYFPEPGIRRRLSRDWGSGRRAFVLGCNPSDADSDRDDPTSLWWNRWFAHHGFAGYDAGNLWSFVAAKPTDCKARVERAVTHIGSKDHAEIYANKDDVVAMARAADQIFACFGNIAWDQAWIDDVLRSIQGDSSTHISIWCWSTTKSGAPTHPMARGRHRLDPLTPALRYR